MIDERTDEQTAKTGCATNMKPTLRKSRFLSRFLSTCYRSTDQTRRYLVLPRPILIVHIEPDDVLVKVRFFYFRLSVRRFGLTLYSSPFPHAILAGGRRRRKAPQRSAEASKMAVCDANASVESLSWPFPLCVSRNGNRLSGGDDAGGRASIAHAQFKRLNCAHNLRNSDNEGPWGLRNYRRLLFVSPAPSKSSRKFERVYRAHILCIKLYNAKDNKSEMKMV